VRVERIDAIDDPRIDVFRDVRDAALRERRGLFLVESRLCVERLMEGGRWPVHAVLVTQTALDSLTPVFSRVATRAPIYLAEPALLRQVVGFDLHRGCIAAAVRHAEPGLDAILAARPRVLVGLESVANPENVGNVFRNALAFGADAVLLSQTCADPLYRKAIRVSMGATLRLPFARIESWPRVIERLRAERVPTLALSTGPDATPLADWLDAHPTLERIVLLLGAEGDGLQPSTRSAAEARVRIPMRTGVDSLNVATASGIALHHCFERL
jgi:tRNA G18 (ribose-2'-O)-methylase SpoU